jgi:hypothetical protein
VSLATLDLTGTWTLKFEKDLSGHPASHECTLQQHKQKLDGTCDGEAKLTGQIRNGKVTLEHTTGRNNEITVRYSAVLNEAATAMKGTWQYVDPTTKSRDAASSPLYDVDLERRSVYTSSSSCARLARRRQRSQRRIAAPANASLIDKGKNMLPKRTGSSRRGTMWCGR